MYLILDMTILALIYFWPRLIFITILVGELGGPKTHNAEMSLADFRQPKSHNFRVASDWLILDGQISY